jgi:hypothetical protein
MMPGDQRRGYEAKYNNRSYHRIQISNSKVVILLIKKF